MPSLKKQREKHFSVRQRPDLDALILAGGLGTRLRSEISDRPKVLAPINQRPFLAFLLDQLSKAGFREVILCIGYMGEAIIETFGDSYADLAITYSKEDQPLGTGGALRLGTSMLPMTTRLMVMNGDSFINADLSAYIDWFFKKNYEASLLLTEVPDSYRFGTVTVASDQVVAFEEKGPGHGPGLINAGVYLFNKKVIQSIPEGIPFSLEHDLFPCLAGLNLHCFQVKNEFIDIGTPETYKQGPAFFGTLS